MPLGELGGALLEQLLRRHQLRLPLLQRLSQRRELQAIRSLRLVHLRLLARQLGTVKRAVGLGLGLGLGGGGGGEAGLGTERGEGGAVVLEERVQLLRLRLPLLALGQHALLLRAARREHGAARRRALVAPRRRAQLFLVLAVHEPQVAFEARDVRVARGVALPVRARRVGQRLLRGRARLLGGAPRAALPLGVGARQLGLLRLGARQVGLLQQRLDVRALLLELRA